jgi:hypothetical protein
MKASALLQELRQNLTPVVAVHGAEATAPVAGQVLVDSLALPNVQGLQPGNLVLVIGSVASTDTAANLAQLAHRNAANAADLELDDAGVGPAGQAGEACMVGIFALQAAGERFVIRPKNAGTAALFYQASLYVFAFPG